MQRKFSALIIFTFTLALGCGNPPEGGAQEESVAPDETAAAPDADISSVSEAYTTSFDTATGRPLVMTMVNGKGPFPFIFDTGAPGVMLMQEFAGEQAFEVVGTDMANSPAGGEPVPVDVVNLANISVAGAAAENVRAIVVDMGPQSPSGARGVVGPAVFSEYGRTKFDFTTNMLEIGGAVETGEDASWIAFGPSAPILDAEVRIGEAVIPAHIDTGAPHVISLPETMADELPLTSPVEVIGMARTIDREFEIKGASLEGVSAYLGDAEIPLGRVTFFDLPFANIGTPALRGLTLEIDWANERYAIEGVAEPAQMQARRRRVERPAEE